MAAATTPLIVNTSFDPQTGVPVVVAPGIARVTAPNRGPLTFTGTNSFLVGADRLVVIDPGPAQATHLEALLRAIDGRPVEAILLTHTHKDHCGLARKLQALTEATIWSGGRHRLSRRRRAFELDPTARASDWRLEPDVVLTDGSILDVAGVTLEVVATPGHCANHLCFGLAGTPWLFSGDHVMGWNSTLVSVPEGSMGDYLLSLRKLIDLPYQNYLPGHGGPVSDGPAHAMALLAHREGRNAQILGAIEGGARRIGQLRRIIYPELALALRPAARMVLAAHVEYLAEAGRIVARRRLGGTELRLA